MGYRAAEETLFGCAWLPDFEIQVERSRCAQGTGGQGDGDAGRQGDKGTGGQGDREAGANPISSPCHPFTLSPPHPVTLSPPPPHTHTPTRPHTTHALVLYSSAALPVVEACSKEARAAGVKLLMPLREAMATMPEAIFLPADDILYAGVFSKIAADLQTVSPLIEISLPGCAFLSLQGLIPSRNRRSSAPAPPTLYRTPIQLITALQRAIGPEWEARIGIGHGKFTAWTAARVLRPEGCFVSPDGSARWVSETQQEEFLKPLPVDLLPVSREMRRKLRAFGLQTLGKLAAMPLPAVIAQFGKDGRRAWMLAHGRDEEPLRPVTFPQEIQESLEFESVETSLDAVTAAAQQLLERTLKHAEQHGRGVRQVRLDARLESGRTWSITITFRQPGARLDQLFPVVRYRLERDHPPEGVESLALALAAVTESPPGGQGTLFPEPRQERQKRLAEAMLQLRTQLGSVPVSRVVEVEPWSRIPERRYRLIDCAP